MFLNVASETELETGLENPLTLNQLENLIYGTLFKSLWLDHSCRASASFFATHLHPSFSSYVVSTCAFGKVGFVFGNTAKYKFLIFF